MKKFFVGFGVLFLSLLFCVSFTSADDNGTSLKIKHTQLDPDRAARVRARRSPGLSIRSYYTSQRSRTNRVVRSETREEYISRINYYQRKGFGTTRHSKEERRKQYWNSIHPESEE